MKKKTVILGALLVAVVAVSVGATLAVTVLGGTEDTAQEADIQINDIGIVFTNTGTETVALGTGKIVPGDEVEVHQSVANQVDGDDGYDIYLKVEIDKYWKDEDGDYMEFDSDVVADRLFVEVDGVSTEIPYLEEGEQTQLGNWILTESDMDHVVMFYIYPLQQGEETTEFISSILFDGSIDNSFSGMSYSIEATGTAVQATNGEAAVAAELGMFLTFDEDGTILSISESKE